MAEGFSLSLSLALSLPFFSFLFFILFASSWLQIVAAGWDFEVGSTNSFQVFVLVSYRTITDVH